MQGGYTLQRRLQGLRLRTVKPNQIVHTIGFSADVYGVLGRCLGGVRSNDELAAGLVCATPRSAQ